MIQDPLAIASLLAIVVVLALRLERDYKLCRALGSGMLVILLGMVLSNSGLLPDTSTTYDWLSSWGVNLSIVLILVGVDLRSVLRAGPTMLIAFFIGALGTAVGAFSAAILLAPQVGEETWKLAGQYTGTYTGGGMNFAALARAFETSSDLFTAAIAADVTMTAIWLMACLTIPVLLGSPGGAPATTDEEEAPKRNGVHTLEDSLRRTRGSVKLEQIALLATLALALVWLSGWIEQLIPAIPQVLWLTSLAVISAQLPFIKGLPGGPLLGNYLLLLFLAGNGAQSVLANIVSIGPGVFYFALLTVAIHGLVIFGLGRLLKLPPSVSAVASQANIGGAASALALASARRYSDQILPGIAVGLLGYAVGNYLGFFIAALARWYLGVGVV